MLKHSVSDLPVPRIIGKGLQEVLTPLQTDLKPVMAASTLLPHVFLICASTPEASEPHTTWRFAGSL